MATIAVNVWSAEITKDTPALNGGNRVYLKPNEYGGRLRLARFNYFPAVAVAAGQVIAMALIPRGARVQKIDIYSNGAVATATLNVGVAAADGSGLPDPNNVNGAGTGDVATVFNTGITIATVGAYSAADTIAHNYGYEAQADIYVIGTLVTAGLAGTGDGFKGHVTFVMD